MGFETARTPSRNQIDVKRTPSPSSTFLTSQTQVDQSTSNDNAELDFDANSLRKIRTNFNNNPETTNERIEQKKADVNIQETTASDFFNSLNWNFDKKSQEQQESNHFLRTNISKNSEGND